MNKNYLYGVIAFITGSFMIVELIFSIISGSLTLQADSFHMISDLSAIFISWFSYRKSLENSTENYTYGLKRFEIIGGLINSVFLLGTCFNIFLESIHRLISIKENSEQIEREIDTVILIGGLGLGINVIIFILVYCSGMEQSHGHSHEEHHDDHKELNTNLKALIMHVLGDALGSVGVVISGLIIKYVKSDYKFYSDPICSLLIIFIIIYNVYPVLKRCINILLQNVPLNIDIQKLKSELLNLPEVVNIHDLHIWQLDDNINIATLHYVLNNNVVGEVDLKIKNILHKYNIHSSTLQVEYTQNCNEITCDNKNCDSNKCCLREKVVVSI